jgi:hypothetical protein
MDTVKTDRSSSLGGNGDFDINIELVEMGHDFSIHVGTLIVYTKTLLRIRQNQRRVS